MEKINKDFLLIFLHGFLGDSGDWDNVINTSIGKKYKTLVIDLPGHGKFTPLEREKVYSEHYLVNEIKKIIEKQSAKEIILIGYSLGARAALSLVSQNPTLIKALILESGTPGIENQLEREERMKKDKELSEKMINNYQDFICNWYNSPIFQSLSLRTDIKDFLTKKRANNNPKEVSKLLIGFSQGIMEPKWDKLKNLTLPVLLITGELDNKYTDINIKMNKLISNSRHCIIKNAGHIPHFENQNDFIKKIEYFLETL